MLSTYLRSKKSRRRHSTEDTASNISTPYSQQRHATADFTETEEDDISDDDDNGSRRDSEEDDEDEEDANEDGEESHLLPLFSSAHLDSLPVYSLTHAIRMIVLPRTETTLSWDQLRSPQVSQFLVKPMQQQIRTSHFSRATLYALMANCLQFQKESQSNPGTAGSSKTRALVCELLAIKLLKEYNVRELIDALSYDFFPLQGVENAAAMGRFGKLNSLPAIVRISTLEISIRASAKRFLAHPLVIQQLESIWAGTIVFHSHADNLHRRLLEVPRNTDENTNLDPHRQNFSYGTSPVSDKPTELSHVATSRRTVTIYDPQDASLFKLSRLRVPRYRQFFSTCSLAILLGLFVAVLNRRSTNITTLEVVFWFWSAGFMLDEVVGFNEQGFSLYIMSFWNAFDLGILLLLSVYYCMRLYGIFLVDTGRQEWNSMAYDVLATNAILLFPRLFSVLDHYRYFSQLLIAFRLMAIDLVAVFVLILVSCSGFFVAFTLSFSKDGYNAAEIAYRIFQILMGFTPAAWEVWPAFNPLGRALMVLFLFMCHFLVVTILITVLTNSFMAIVSNAEQEHQFVFAVNTISMVKNDALFSYVAPSNILAWFLTPMRLILSFRTFIRVNRMTIKLTHFPLLFGIFVYEKIFLSWSVFEPTFVVEREKGKGVQFQERKLRLRQESAAGFKDRALEEVFRLAPRPDTLRKNSDQVKSQNAIKNWMNQHTPPPDDGSAIDRGEARQARINRALSGTRSAASDPVITTGAFSFAGSSSDDAIDDREDETETHDDMTPNQANFNASSPERNGIRNPELRKLRSPSTSVDIGNRPSRSAKSPLRKSHYRNMSTNTIVFNPVSDPEPSVSPANARPPTAKKIGIVPGLTPERKSLKPSVYGKSHPRVIIPPRGMNFNINPTMSRTRQMKHRRSSLEMVTSQVGLDPAMLGAVPSSFATQMAMATGALKNVMRDQDNEGMMGRLMLARMKTLEEGFAEVVKEFRVMRNTGSSSSESNSRIKTKPIGETSKGVISDKLVVKGPHK
ncbi:BgtA-20897 [Blumeria graminis f. sp. tritici]|uniref:BgtA-20897 n=2 Tax=Blumeria graminis f. sp. tritici TaxID=62690 RepID=A0A9X9L7S3_BLUGR|nr:hypothetical protein BGT96224_A20897 [Blumeria graminis f. sp. tritici 96224]VCU39157.1 BgtA-20897 [Blumeria graminis f. sp. tritici]